MHSDDKFYSNQKGFASFKNYTRASDFKPVPEDWLVAIAAVVNNVKPVTIPFVFGGDGAVFCFPGNYKDKVSSALLASEQLAKVDFKMNLRIGIVPVSELRKRRTDVKTAKYQPSKYYQKAMFSGNGISLAEDLVKADNEFKIHNPAIIPEANFN